FAEDRIKIADEMIKELADKIVDKGEGHQRARVALSIALAQYGNGAHFIGNYIGGEHAHRDHKGDDKGRDPLVPVKAAKQREALKFLQEHILSDQAFQFSPQLLRRLGYERWSHWGGRMGSTDYPLYDQILRIQQIALDQLLDAAVLRRIQGNALKAEKEEQPLQVAEVFRSLTDAIWSEAGNGQPKDAGGKDGGKDGATEDGAKEGKDVKEQ